MKKAIAYFFTMLIMLLVFSSFLISCKAKLPAPDINKEVFTQKDTTSHIKITDNSKAIIDSLLIAIGKIKTAKPECDSVAQAAVDNVLRSINSSKKSGDNGYQLKYNELLKRLELVVKIGATKNEATKDFIAKETFSDRFITKTITLERKLPKWQLILMLIGSGTIIFSIFKAVIFVRRILLV
jgi:hypothetical protein